MKVVFYCVFVFLVYSVFFAAVIAFLGQTNHVYFITMFVSMWSPTAFGIFLFGLVLHQRRRQFRDFRDDQDLEEAGRSDPSRSGHSNSGSIPLQERFSADAGKFNRPRTSSQDSSSTAFESNPNSISSPSYPQLASPPVHTYPPVSYQPESLRTHPRTPPISPRHQNLDHSYPSEQSLNRMQSEDPLIEFYSPRSLKRSTSHDSTSSGTTLDKLQTPPSFYQLPPSPAYPPSSPASTIKPVRPIIKTTSSPRLHAIEQPIIPLEIETSFAPKSPKSPRPIIKSPTSARPYTLDGAQASPYLVDTSLPLSKPMKSDQQSPRPLKSIIKPPSMHRIHTSDIGSNNFHLETTFVSSPWLLQDPTSPTSVLPATGSVLNGGSSTIRDRSLSTPTAVTKSFASPPQLQTYEVDMQRPRSASVSDRSLP
ncbi:hypothetical protein HDU97_009393 [Phlyctochytrium planicorne]|nr:hypothetical protein HDU97_009393 [Phlyctochytrium planicorne]